MCLKLNVHDTMHTLARRLGIGDMTGYAIMCHLKKSCHLPIIKIRLRYSCILAARSVYCLGLEVAFLREQINAGGDEDGFPSRLER